MIAAIPPAPSAPDATVDEVRLHLLRVLADPTRYRIFSLLLRGETCNCELGEALGLTSNLVSHHLRQLREVGLVREHRDPSDARWLHLTVDPAGLADARALLLALLGADTLGERTPACGFVREARR